MPATGAPPLPEASISVIVPVWGHDIGASEFALGWSHFSGVREVIVCAPDTGTPLPPLLGSDPVKFCVSPEVGRGIQMNCGAEFAVGGVLLFHHADSILTEDHIAALAWAMRDARIVGGAFHRKFDGRHPHLKCLESLERLHCNLFGTLYGDQSLFVRKSHFQDLGGFASIPLMEDVEFSKRLRRSGKVIVLDPPMQTSGRKHQKEGAWKVTLQNMLLLLLFRCGVPAKTLHAWYYGGGLRSRQVTETVMREPVL